MPATELDDAVEDLADRIAGVPINQLVMQKLMINQAYDNMGLHGTQILATLFDGITRHSPEGRWFQEFAETHGFHAAVQWRDSGRWIPNGGGPIPTADELPAGRLRAPVNGHSSGGVPARPRARRSRRPSTRAARAAGRRRRGHRS